MDKVALIGKVLFVGGLICDLLKGFIDDKKTERMIDEKVKEHFEERKEENKGS